MRTRGLSCTELLIVLVVGFLSVTLAMPALMRPRDRSNGAKCSNNLRQLGLAAIQYADDHRFFPHLGPIGTLQGGLDSSDGPRVVRALVWHGYHDNTEGFICPSSYDLQRPMSDATKVDLKRWSWGGAEAGNPDVSPLREDGVHDPVLRDTDELSYGWTRRGMSSNVRSSALLAADRSCRPLLEPGVDARPGDLGNHSNGVFVLQADGKVTWTSLGAPGADLLTAVSGEGAGMLGIAPLVEGPDAGPGWYHESRGEMLRTWGPIAAGVLPPLLVAGMLELFGRRRRRLEALTIVVRPGEGAARGGVRPVRPSRVETLGPDERAALRLGAPPPTDGKVTLQAEQRCPLCHDVVQADAPLTRCAVCRAVFHADCVSSGGDCPTLGCGG